MPENARPMIGGGVLTWTPPREVRRWDSGPSDLSNSAPAPLYSLTLAPFPANPLQQVTQVTLGLA